VDFWNLWSRKTGIPVTFSITSWEDSLQQIKDDRADINAGVFFNKDRDRFLDFSRSFFDIPSYLFHRPGIHPTLDTLQNFRIGSVKGDFSTQYLAEQGVNAIDYKSHELLIAHALEGRIDAFIMEAPVGESYLAKRNGLDRLVKPTEPVYTQSFRAGIKEGRLGLLADINTGLSRISQDEIQGILNNWTGSTAAELVRPLPKRVVIAISVDQQPFHFVDKDGHAMGMVVDLWRLWGRENGIDIEFKSGTWSESLAMVREGKADIHAGCFYSKDREVYMDFAVPLISCDTHFFFHNSVFGLKDLEDLVGFKIGVLENDFAAEFIRQHLPGAYIAPYPSNQALFDAIKKGDIRVFVGDTPTALFFLKEKGIQTQYRHHPARPLYTNTYFAAVAKGNPALVEAVKKGFSAISPREKAAIEQQWTGRSRRNPEDVLVISFEKDFPPYAMLTPQGHPAGIFVDFWRLWSKKTGRIVEFRVQDRSETRQALMTEQVDIHSAMIEDENPDPLITLSQPFYRIHSRLFYRANRAIDSLDDADGQPVAAVRGGPTAAWLARNRPGSPLHLFDTEEEVVLAAARGEVDFFAGPSTVLQTFLSRYGLTSEYKHLERPLLSRNICAAIRGGRADRLTLVNAGIGGVSLQEMARIAGNWIQDSEADLAAPPQILLSENEQAWLDRHHTIRLGFPPDFPPFDFTDKDGNYQGITSDYVNLLNQRLNLGIEIVTGLTWSQILARTEDGKRDVDLISSAAPTDSVTAFTLLTDAYTEFPWVIITRRDTPLIGSLRDLYGRSTAVLRDFTMHERLQRDHPGIPLVPADTVAEGLEAVLRRDMEAYVGNLAAASYLIQKENYTDLKIASTTSYGNESISFGVRSDWPELVSILNKGLASISPQERDQIRQRWFSVRFEHGLDRTDIWKAVLGIGGLSCMLILLVMLRSRHIHRARMVAEAANNAKGEFLASLSHEIRSSMNVIMGMTELMLGDTSPKAQQENLQNTREAAGHLMELIDDILDLSKIEAEKVRVNRIDFDLDRLLEGIIRTYRPQALQKGVSLHLEKDAKVPSRLNGDAIRLRQILINLIGNAIKFTDQGSVRVRVRRKPAHRSDGWIYCFAVHDTGMGIPPDKLDIIFDSFTRLGRTTGQRGTGLGLAICRRFADLMDGWIRVESSPGKGSTFFLELPLRPGKPIEHEGENSTPEHGPSGFFPAPERLTILLAEDSGLNATVTARFLQQIGHDVTLARTGTQVIETLTKEDIDLVFMDVEMPELDGMEACRRIRAGAAGDRCRDLPVVALTAHSMHEYREKCIKAGMNDFLVKPVDAATLDRTIRHHCGVSCEETVAKDADHPNAGREPELPVPTRLDRETALYRCGGSEELLVEIWSIFAQETPGILDEMEHAVTTGDLNALIYIAHNLKSASDRIGAMVARDRASKLEHFAREGKSDGVAPMAAELSRELTAVIDTLNRSGAENR